MQESRRRGVRVWMAFVLALGVILRLYAAGTENRQSPDTFQYARQAEMLRLRGVDGWREEAARFVRDPEMAAVPSVERTVFLGALAGWMKLTQTSGTGTVMAFSCVLDIFALVMVAVLAWDVLGEEAAVAAGLLYAVDPAVLAMARHGWSDSAVAVTGLLVLLLAVRCLRGKRWAAPMLGICAALSFGVKETAFLQACVVLALALSMLVKNGQRREAVRLTVIFAVAMAAMFGWTAFALGGAGRVLYLFGVGRDAHAQVVYAVEYQTGSVAQWLRAVWLADPVVMTLAAYGTVMGALRWRSSDARERMGWLLCVPVCAVFLVVPMFGSALYNVRWIAPMFAPACVLGALGLRLLWRTVAGSGAVWTPLAVAGLGLCAVLSLWRYQALVAGPDLQDLSLKMVLTGHN